jgi:heptosyltransferase I
VNILLVKLSSLGDVLHNLPVVWDIRKQYPDAHIAWAVEEGYVHLLEPLKSTLQFRGIDQIIPVCLRRAKKELFKGRFKTAIQDFSKMKQVLKSQHWDVIVETQGLMKSALIAGIAKQGRSTTIVYGIGNQTQYSGYEPLAKFFYDQSVQVPFQFHAVDRSRAILASSLQLDWPQRDTASPQFYPPGYIHQLQLEANPLDFSPQEYVMCFHATARIAKAWDEAAWIAIGKYLVSLGLTPVFPWGNAAEKLVSERLVSAVPGAKLPSAFSIKQAAILVAQARLTIGVDTGLTHYSAVLNLPTIELYVDSPLWKTEGYWSRNVINLGDMGKPPTVDEVTRSIQQLI